MSIIKVQKIRAKLAQSKFKLKSYNLLYCSLYSLHIAGMQEKKRPIY